MTRIKHIFISLFIILLSTNTYSQKVGLVLSGGGAKGLYHIGIIKALEENGIPIDYISGTSMGSIVGGMYASGYSAEEMAEIFESGIVDYWIKGKIEDKYKYYYKQNEPLPAMLSLNLDLAKLIKGSEESEQIYSQDSTKKVEVFKEKLVSLAHKEDRVNSNTRTYAMYSSVQLDLATLQFFGPASAYAKNNFDSLFVPFRCVSVDIIKKEEYLWKKGSLSKAIRSSMAIPIVFKPVIEDTMLMYDGGLRNNFPWKEIKEEFNPDIIIGAMCVNGITDLSSVVSQIEMLVVNETNYNMPEEDGIMIKKNVDVGMLDYGKAKEIIQMGYVDAIGMMPQIKERISRRVSPEEVKIKRLAFKESLPALEFDKFNIEGLTDKQEEYIKGQLNNSRNNKGETISYEEFKADYLNIINEDVFDGEIPKATYNERKGLFDLSVDMYSKPSFKAMVGLNISSTSVNEAFLGLHYRSIGRISSTYMLDSYIGSFYSSVKLGSRHNLYGGKTPYYIEPMFVYNFFDYARGNSQRISYNPTDIEYSRLNDVYGSLTLGMPITRNSKLEFRVSGGRDAYKYTLSNTDFDITSPDKSKVRFASLNISLERNNLNYLMYPTSGIRERVAAFGSASRESFTSAADSLGFTTSGIYKNLYAGASYSREKYFNINKYFNLGYQFDALYSSYSINSSEYMDKMLAPAYQPTSHSKTLLMPEFRSRRYVAFGLMPIVKLNEEVYIKVGGYSFFPDFGVFDQVDDRLRFIFDSSIVYQSPIGAISVSYSRYANVQSVRSDYFTFNIGVSLFNKKGIIF
ncbi:MAG: patatin-like phospholipase family protein [Rikenellaceae bacterium]